MRIEKIGAGRALQLRQEVLRPGHPLEASVFTGDKNPDAGHYGAIEDGADAQVVAVGTVYHEPCDSKDADAVMRSAAAWRLRGMATSGAFRGQGLGAQILKACLEHARSGGAQTVWCNARIGAVNFYLRHGFVKMSEVYEMPGIGPHFLMKHDF